MGWWQRVGGITSTIPLLSFSSPSPLLHSPFLSPSLLPSRTSALSAQTKHLFASGERFGGGRGEGGGGRGGGRDGDNIFVSSYYREISKEEVLDYLKTKSIQFKDGIPPKEWAVVKYCSNCPPHKGQLDNLFKLYIYKGGPYHCHRCGSHGSWYDFKKKHAFGESSLALDEGFVREFGANLPAPRLDSNQQSGNSSYSLQKSIEWKLDAAKLFSYELEHSKRVLSYLTEKRQLSVETLTAYLVGACQQKFSLGEEHECVSFPWLVPKEGGEKESEQGERSEDKSVYNTHKLVRAKIRSIDDKKCMRLYPSNAGWGFFGLHLVPRESKSIIITEGEYDAMAVYQATKLPAVSLPNGASSLPLEVIPLLERFEEIILWMDNDTAGATAAQKFSKKLGIGRCRVVPAPRSEWGPEGSQKRPKDANDALKMGWDLKKMIEAAQHIPHAKIATSRDYEAAILRELQDPRAAGRQSTELPSLSKLLKGFRPGELTIFSGASGIGKTTFLSQMSLEFCAQGESTLWGSFEIQNHRLVNTMMKQFHKVNAFRLLENFENFSNLFQELPLFFLRYHGSTNINELIEVMEYAVYKFDVSHIVLDNLQFMVSGQAFGAKKFDYQDQVVSLLRQFATSKNVHITLVLHPRKLQENERVTMGSLFGSAKSVQEADNVVVLQNDNSNGLRHLEVLKNRYDGDLGRIPILFDKQHLRFVELDQQEQEILRQQKKIENEKKK